MSCAQPLPLPRLLEYWLGELDAAGEESVELHLLACASCAGRVADMARLGAAIRGCFVQGRVSAVLSARFAHDLAATGWRIREYRVPANGRVNCTVAPDDDFTLARLQAPLAGVERLDLVRIARGSVVERLANVPFDAGAGEVVFAPAMTGLRELRDETIHVDLVDASGDEPRVIAGYDFVHSACTA